MATRLPLLGNRLALTGAVLYLSEWVVIVAVPPPGPFDPAESTSTIVRGYADGVVDSGLTAVWFAAVLVGRVLFVLGVRAAVAGEPRRHALLDFAAAAMTLSVALEVTSYAVAAGASTAAERGAGDAAVVAANAVGHWVNLAGFPLIGISLAAVGFALLSTDQVAAWWAWAPLVAAPFLVLPPLMLASGEVTAGLVDGLTSIGALTFWVWMLALSVKIWRAPHISEEAASPHASRA